MKISDFQGAENAKSVFIIPSHGSGRLNKHDRYVLDLCERIRERYDYLLMHYKIQNSKRSFGEIDICAVKGGRIDLYEVKCSFRIHKAEKQLKRAKRLIRSNGYSYFYCGSSGQLQEIAI